MSMLHYKYTSTMEEIAPSESSPEIHSTPNIQGTVEVPPNTPDSSQSIFSSRGWIIGGVSFLLILIYSVGMMTVLKETIDKPISQSTSTVTPIPTLAPVKKTLSLEDKKSVQKLTSAHVEFGLALLKELYKNAKATNISVSPSSVANGIGMMYIAAGDETLKEMTRALSYNNLPMELITTVSAQLSKTNPDANTGISIITANALWQKNTAPLNSAYVSDVQKYFNAESILIDFSKTDSALAQINGWVNTKTQTLIPKIVDKLPADAVAVLTNAIYFKGLWTNPFDPIKTVLRNFTTRAGTMLSVPTMEETRKFDYLETATFQAVKLSYGPSRSFSMILFLPKTSLDSFVSSLNINFWKNWSTSFYQQEGTVELPSFTLKYESSLRDSLSKIGMETAFTKFANFSKMETDKTQQISIGDVIHSVRVEVNEQGTIAAAATAVIPVSGGGGESPPPFLMTLNKPFVFAITDDINGELYFLGIVQDPSIKK